MYGKSDNVMMLTGEAEHGGKAVVRGTVRQGGDGIVWISMSELLGGANNEPSARIHELSNLIHEASKAP